MNTNKITLLEHFKALENNDLDAIKTSVQEHFHDGCSLDAFHPLNNIKGKDDYFEKYLKPLYQSFRGFKRANHILIGGVSNNEQWVSTTGYSVGIFRKDYCGIPASGKLTYLRFGESFQFNEEGKIIRSILIIDLISLMLQAGYRVLPPDLGSEVIVPAPQTQDGIVLTEQDASVSKNTLQVVEDMLFKGLMNFDGKDFGGMGLEKYWDPEMMWYGPAGIGTSQGIDGFQDYHQKPFLIAFPDRKGGNHDLRFADGKYAVSTGWPSLHATHLGGNWLGTSLTGKKMTMRVMDFWRCEKNLLVENWVLLDNIDTLLQLGTDIFARLEILKENKKHRICN